MIKKRKERRRHPRLKVSLPFKLSGKDLVISTKTKNISCSGAYCSIDKAIAPMSKVKVSMEIPTIKKGNIATEQINCKGVVVRCDPPQQDQPSITSNTAIMFTDLPRRNENIIARYVKYQLTKLRLQGLA